MNTHTSSRSTTDRISAFFAAAVVTTVVMGSQFGLAQRYDAQTRAVMAGQTVSGQVVKTTAWDQPG